MDVLNQMPFCLSTGIYAMILKAYGNLAYSGLRVCAVKMWEKVVLFRSQPLDKLGIVLSKVPFVIIFTREGVRRATVGHERWA